jgi:predicted transport protein
MPIFVATENKLKKLSTVPVASEKRLQTLIEENLLEVLDMHFLETEYVTTFGGRIDTLAVDVNGAPVIIEYKRGRNDNVVNQALSYLKWLKSQKQEFFEKLISDRLSADICRTFQLDWKNPRVICIAESYSKFDVDTVEVIPLRIELIRYRFHERNVFTLEPVNVPESVEVRPAVARTRIEAGSVVDLDAHLSKASQVIVEVFHELRERIMALDDAVIEKPTKIYIAYRLANNFAEIMIGKEQIKIHLKPLDYQDPKEMIERIPESYKWSLSRRVYLRSIEDLEYVVGLIQQSYQDVL